MALTAHDDLHVVMAASEAVPYAKTGGLADVVTALAMELSKLGHRVTLLVPGYQGQAAQAARQGIMRFSLSVAGTTVELMVDEELVPVTGASHPLRVFFIRYDRYFDRPGLYQEDHHDYPDNLERFTLFCRGVLSVLSILTEVQGSKSMYCICMIGRPPCAQCISKHCLMSIRDFKGSRLC